jgi:hypothetical protein
LGIFSFWLANISENSTRTKIPGRPIAVSPALLIDLGCASQRGSPLWSPCLLDALQTFSAAVFGMDAYLVEVELYIGPSYQGNSNLVGLPDIAVKRKPRAN